MTNAEFLERYPFHHIEEIQRIQGALKVARRMQGSMKDRARWEVGFYAERGLLETLGYERECLAQQCAPWFKAQR